MSIEAMAWAKRQKTGNSTTKLVLLMHADWANPGPKDGPKSTTADGRHYGWAGQEEMADACEMSLSSVKRHEKALVELGLIRKEQRFSRAGNRLSDFVVLAVGTTGDRPFPVDVQEVGEGTGTTKCQPDPLSRPAEMTKGQSDLRAAVTLGPSVTAATYMTVVPDSKDLSLSEEQPSAPPGDPVENPKRERSAPGAKPTRGSALVDELVAEALERHPGWSRRMTRKAIQDELDDGRPPDKVAAAWRACIVAPSDGPPSPGRFKHSAGPWWDVAYKPAVAPAQRKPPCKLCDHGWVIDQETRLPLEPAVKCTHKAMAGVS